MVVLRAVGVIVGLWVVQGVLRSAVRTVVVPQGEQLRLTRFTFLAMRALYDAQATRERTAGARDRHFARYAPMSLVVLAGLWAVLTIVGFVPVYWAIGDESLWDSVRLSGSSFTTLGFVPPANDAESLIAVVEALIGLGLVALLISYLPTLYGLFNRREAAVAKLEVRAGSPPTALEMLIRFHRIGWLEQIEDVWAGWEEWFNDLEESHTSHPALVFFASQHSGSSWVTGAGAVLDAAAIWRAALDTDPGPQSAVTIRAGYIALRSVARFYGVPFDPDPAPNDPISIHRQEFDLLLDELAAAGVALRADRDQAWRDFAGWRVTYDTPLLALARLCDAPPTPWSSDRLERFHRPTLAHRRWSIDPPDTPASW